MASALPYWRESMAACTDTNPDFERLNERFDAFFTAEDWEETARANYAANQAAVDQNWQFALDSWNTKVYFNAGMFYARVLDTLTANAASQMPF